VPVATEINTSAGWWFFITTLVLLFGGATNVSATPRTPVDENEVLEKLPVSFLGKKDNLSVLQKKLLEQPDNLSLAIVLAKKYIEAGREQSDPRQFGYAQAALRTWWNETQPPNEILLLRATIRQHHHQYDEAVTDLKALLKRQPRHAQAWLTLSVVQQVRGDYAGVRASCASLARVASSWISSLCYSQVMAVTGEAERAYQIQSQLARDPEQNNVELRQWLLTLAGETALMLGKNKSAENHFKKALGLGHRDPYLLRVYSDLLIQQLQPKAVLKLLADEVHDDALLLRLAIAAKHAGKTKIFQQYKSQLEARYRAAQLRGSRLHEREEALFFLQVNKNSDKALELALSNWAIQKELEDTRIVLMSALESKQYQRISSVLYWIKKNKTQDVRLNILIKRIHENFARN